MKRDSKGYTEVDTPLFQTMLVQGQTLQGEGSTIPVESHHTPISAPSTSQPPTSPPSMQTTYVAEEVATIPHDSPLPRVHSLGSDEASIQNSTRLEHKTSLPRLSQDERNDISCTRRLQRLDYRIARNTKTACDVSEISASNLQSLYEYLDTNTRVSQQKGDLRKFSDIGAWDDVVRIQEPRCMAWLDYDEHVDSLSTIDNEVGVTSPKSTAQTLPSFEECTPPVTYPEEVEKTLGTPIEVEPLNETKLKEVGLNNTHFSFREVPSFDGPEPQPLLNSLSLDVIFDEKKLGNS
ncbi:hypothetical protein Tco_0998293 [Tanacetum coccineum]